MHYEGTTYRPPVEADTLLLQVTVGCAHNKCTYCDMYKDICFRMEKLDQIEEDLKEARMYYKHAGRIFLVNGDAFVLKADYLKAIVLKIKEYFPECNTITMYASIQNIKSKTNEELLELRALGINDLYVGIESGLDEVLAHVNKGHTIEEAKTQLERLNKAKIDHVGMIMLGIAGKDKGVENAKATAEFFNITKPKLIMVCSLCVFSGTELSNEIENGTFIEASELELMIEQKTLIENIQLEGTFVFALHPTNPVLTAGMMPKDKEKMLEVLEKGINKYDVEVSEKAKKLKRKSL